MIRKIALASALLAASLSAGALSAQSTATTPQKPAAAPAMKQTPAPSPAAKPATPARHATWTKAQIKEAQEGLAKAGLYKGKATGVMNSPTRSALRAYQKQNKLPVTGRLSDSVLVKLKST
jgi:peptidoglycan hydrolase-like protein with peptidoglycan-binding domain